MLDEWKEYFQYTVPPKYLGRLRLLLDRDRIKSSGRDKGDGTHACPVLGITRPLSIVARGRLFGLGPCPDGGRWPWPENKRIDDAMGMLPKWLGIGCGPDTGPDDRSWLPEYVEEYAREYAKERHARAKGQRQGLEELAEKYQDRAATLYDGWADYMKAKEYYSSTVFDIWDANDENRLTYERIVANAIRRGPLRRYYLAGRPEVMDSLMGERNGIFAWGKRERILAATVAYLLQAGPRSGEGRLPTPVVRFSLCDLSAWLGYETELEKKDVEPWRYVDGSRGLNEGILRPVRGAGLYHMGEHWLRDGDWQLIDATEGDDELDAFLEGHGRDYSFWSECPLPKDMGKNGKLGRDEKRSGLLLEGVRYRR